MNSIVMTIALGVGAFISTDLDDIFVLLTFFADPSLQARQIVGGQFLGIGVLVAISLVVSLASLVVPAGYIGLFGLIPLLLGLKKLWDRRRGVAVDDHENEVAGAAASRNFGSIVAVAVITIANGGDNIGTYTPLFAARPSWEIATMIAVFAGMTGIWCASAYWLTRHPAVRAHLQHWGPRVVPFFLMALGLCILIRAGSFDLLSAAASHSP